MKNIKPFYEIIYITLFLLIALSGKATDKYVVVLSMDGFRPDYTEKVQMNILDSLARVGVSSVFQPCFPSRTFPNHYSMATGLHPDRHGIINNNFYASDLDLVYRASDPAAVTNPAFYDGEPIWNTAEKQGIRTASFFWIGSEAPIQERHPSIYKKYDKTVPFRERADSVISWLQLPEEIRPRLIMWYLEEPDAIGHITTPESQEMIEKLKELDLLLDYFFSKVKTLDIFEQIDFIVVSDHGMATYTPETYVNLNNYLPRDSFLHIFEGVPTFLYPNPSFTYTALKLLENIPGITAYKKEDIPEKYKFGSNPRIGDIVVVPHTGTNILFREEIEYREGGAHGYDNFDPLMQGVFYAAGPSFKKNFILPVMENINLYLIIAQIFQLDPAPNDGNPDLIKQLFVK